MLSVTSLPPTLSSDPSHVSEDKSGLLGTSVVADRSCESPCCRFWRYMKAEHPKALLVTGIVIGGLTLGVVPAAVTYAVTRDLLRTSAALGAGSTLLVCIGNRLHARADQLDNAV